MKQVIAWLRAGHPHLRPECLCGTGSDSAEKPNASSRSKAPNDLVLGLPAIAHSVYPARSRTPQCCSSPQREGNDCSESLMKAPEVLWESDFTTRGE